MSPPSSLPEVPPGVFSVSVDVLIDAPIETVWNAIFDFPSYNKWNPFVRDLKIVDPNTRHALGDQTPAVGRCIYMHPVHLPPTFDDANVRRPQSALVLITTLDHEGHRVSWDSLLTPNFPSVSRARRWQVLSEVDGKTRYESREVFSGILAYLISFLYQSALNEGFRASTEELKKYCEHMR